jgi:hypothetical protein
MAIDLKRYTFRATANHIVTEIIVYAGNSDKAQERASELVTSPNYRLIRVEELAPSTQSEILAGRSVSNHKKQYNHPPTSGAA